jgi:anti-sigma factor RsiW
MCPNKRFLSIYFDGELPSPWNEQMEKHLESCPDCAKGIEIYKKTSELLNDSKLSGADNSLMEAAKSHVWEKIIAGKQMYPLYQSPRQLPRQLARQPPRFLPLRLPRIPGSIAAGAAGAIAATALILVISFITPPGAGKNKLPEISGAAESAGGITVSSDYELDIPEITPALNMNDVLRYIENSDSSNIVIIKLPERKKFNRYGEPAFINAADYRKGPAN